MEGRARLIAGATALNQPLTERQIEQLLAFVALIEKWNKAYNLTAIRKLSDSIDLHLLDSLAIAPYVTGRRIIDIGTGAGLPGIPLAIALPDAEFVLLDSNAKKTRFVQQAVLELKLNNVSVCHSRVEDYRPEQPFDTVLTRAFAGLAGIVRLSAHLLSPEGVLLAMKGLTPDAELAELPDAIAATVLPLQIPNIAAERCLIRLTARHAPVSGFKDAVTALLALQRQHPEWFPNGLNGVYAVPTARFFAAFVEGNLYLSTHTEPISGFNAAKELALAFQAMQNKQKLSFNHEYAIETLYHELIHSSGRHETDNNRYIFQVEPIIQWIARNDYPVLLAAFGYKAEHQESIIKRGYGYANPVNNLIWLFSKLGINPIAELRDAVTKRTFSAIRADAIKSIALLSGVNELEIARCINYLRIEYCSDFRAKVENILGYRSNRRG